MILACYLSSTSTSMVFSRRFARLLSPLRRLYSSQITPQQINALRAWSEQITTIERHLHEHISANKVLDLFCMLPTRKESIDKAYKTYQRGGGSPYSTPYTDAVPQASNGSSLLPTHSLAFFHAHAPETLLGSDQTETDFNPPAESGFTRRMWAGGKFRWGGGPGDLIIGRDACATARVVKVETKGFYMEKTEDGINTQSSASPMVFVHQNIDYRHTDSPQVLFSEERVHVYQPASEVKPRQDARPGAKLA